jgi:hypothetical protein
VLPREPCDFHCILRVAQNCLLFSGELIHCGPAVARERMPMLRRENGRFNGDLRRTEVSSRQTASSKSVCKWELPSAAEECGYCAGWEAWGPDFFLPQLNLLRRL